MNLAIIESGGKQYLIQPNTKIQIEKIEGKAGDAIKLEKVLLSSVGSKFELGAPMVSGAAIDAKILKQGRGKKIVVFKYKAKSKYRRKQGHRQSYTEIEVGKF